MNFDLRMLRTLKEMRGHNSTPYSKRNFRDALTNGKLTGTRVLNDKEAILNKICQWILWHINHCRLFNAKFSLYIYIRYEVHTISFKTFFVWAFKIVVDSWKFIMLLLYIIWDDFRFKSTAIAGIVIHPTKTWLSQLMNFKNAIWTWGHFSRTICNKIMF